MAWGAMFELRRTKVANHMKKQACNHMTCGAMFKSRRIKLATT